MLNMSRFISLLCTTAFLVFSADAYAVSQIHGGEHLHIGVFYESLCPDSVSFIRDQLYPTYLKFTDFVVIDWVPYGAASHRRGRDGSYTFRCQHGEEECLGNKIQACAIDVLGETNSPKWINCVMSTGQPQSAGDRCSRTLGVDFEPIRACSTSIRGDQLLAHYGDLTDKLRPRITFVPTVIFNGIYDSLRQERAMTDLRSVICSYMPEHLQRGRCQ